MDSFKKNLLAGMLIETNIDSDIRTSIQMIYFACTQVK